LETVLIVMPMLVELFGWLSTKYGVPVTAFAVIQV